MWVAEMESEHFSWRAAGRTEPEACAALAAAWDRHMGIIHEQTGGLPVLTGEMAVADYGARTWEALAGVGLMDGSVMVEGVEADVIAIVVDVADRDDGVYLFASPADADTFADAVGRDRCTLNKSPVMGADLARSITAEEVA